MHSRSPCIAPPAIATALFHRPSRECPWRRFVEALSIQWLTPKAGFFFLAVFPQLIQPEGNYLRQFLLLVASYGLLVRVVHSKHLCRPGQRIPGLAVQPAPSADRRQALGESLPGPRGDDGHCQSMSGMFRS
ncbi:hypothetical protein [Pseudomonas sessilinigenes]|uniref:Uncharacterized protein n=1 Tax=Pseudomonas sessilinigenes TaxID=658629 RepID=A0ABX8MKE6_9PSED|nr:hypothetical protein [Pseudomonas sessilinigenes]AZC26286.1 Lysine exporter protein (LYSE/YGGA) [Pseudomonas sessilinigenes]QXH39696.1 hypothetical protein KSS89_26295 [Pseudomonas sessilinigenes]